MRSIGLGDESSLRSSSNVNCKRGGVLRLELGFGGDLISINEPTNQRPIFTSFSKGCHIVLERAVYTRDMELLR